MPQHQEREAVCWTEAFDAGFKGGSNDISSSVCMPPQPCEQCRRFLTYPDTTRAERGGGRRIAKASKDSSEQKVSRSPTKSSFGLLPLLPPPLLPLPLLLPPPPLPGESEAPAAMSRRFCWFARYRAEDAHLRARRDRG